MIPKGGFLASAALSLLVLAASTVMVFAGGPRQDRDPEDRSPEAVRVQDHLVRVERELLARDVTMLTEAQRAERRVQIARLRTYRLGGTFPHNHDFPSQRVPYFVDRHGTHCAMAYLIAASGREDIVREVARSRNNARVTELAADPALGPVLAAWLVQAGLSVEEAQRIQPTYGGGGRLTESDRMTTAYTVGSGVLATVNAFAIGINGADAASGQGPVWVGVAGVTVGTAEMVLGITNWNRHGTRGIFAVGNTAIGALSFVLSSASLANHSREPVYVEAPAGPVIRPGAWVHERLGPMVGIAAAF